ncbi:PAXX protein, partial [Furnarius figulus]|nr:PAXX protein [Furnarius figulus]
MAEPAGPFHLLRAGPGRFLCYCRPGGAVWCVPPPRVPSTPGSPHPRLLLCPAPLTPSPCRAALGRGAAELSLGPGSATLRLPEEPRCPALALAQLPAAEARSQLQALVFGMAGCIESLERRLEGLPEHLADLQSTSCLSLTEADPSPRKNKAAGSALPAKRRVPGESLINPGFKRSVLGLGWRGT